MPFILVIEPDHHQAAQLKNVIGRRLHVEVIVAKTTQQALKTIESRVPDVVLVPALLSPRDETALSTALRANAAAAAVQVLTIPTVTDVEVRAAPRGFLSRLRRDKTPEPALSDGDSLSTFVDQIAAYLQKPRDQAAEPEVAPVAAPIAAPVAAPIAPVPVQTVSLESGVVEQELTGAEAIFESLEPGDIDLLGPADAPGPDLAPAPAPVMTSAADDPPTTLEHASPTVESKPDPAPWQVTGSYVTRTEWTGLDPAHSGFATMFAKLHELIGDAHHG